MSRVSEAWRSHPGRNLDGALTVQVPGGGAATIGHVEDSPDGAVLVWTGPREGPPHLRVTGLDDHPDPITVLAQLLATTREGGAAG